jgi:hypothetical protein
MIRTQVSLGEVDYKLAKKEARAFRPPPALRGCDTPASSNPATLAPASL